MPVHHQLPEPAQTHVHRVSDAIQPSYPLTSYSSPAPNPFQHQGLFQWVNSSHEVVKVLEFQLQHIHNWVLFLLWLHPFILSGVTSPLISSSILGTYWPGEFPFQYPIILPFHTVHGVLKARILKWFVIPFSSGPHSVRLLHHDPPILGGPTWHGLVSLS